MRLGIDVAKVWNLVHAKVLDIHYSTTSNDEEIISFRLGK